MGDDIQKLKKAIALKQVVVFIGRGVSRYTTDNDQDAATCIGLLKSGLEQCYQYGWIENSDLNYFIEKFDTHQAIIDDYLGVADKIQHCFEDGIDDENNDAYKLWLNETIGKLVSKNSELIKAIGGLECPIVTTNYDGLLEDVLHKNALTWNTYKSNVVGDLFENMKNFILHIHGYYKESDSIVFSSEDYHKILANEFAQSTLKALLKNKTLLFLGYGAEMSDPNFANLSKWKFWLTSQEAIPIYKLVTSNKNNTLNQASDVCFLENTKEIPYGETHADLLKFIKGLTSFTPLLNEMLSFNEETEVIRKKYLHFLTKEFGYVSIFGYSKTNISLPLENVYVELKFDPTHPSIKAMKMLEVSEEFKRKILSNGFFSTIEMSKIFRAVMEIDGYHPQNIYRDLMIEQWLNVLLNKKNIFSTNEASSIKNKINRLKSNILKEFNIKEAKQYHIQQAYNQLKHFIILGHPGSGKTTLSKWLIINMAKHCLGEQNMLFDSSSSMEPKLPILIPIWKYVDYQLKESQSEKKTTLIEFIYENSTLDSTDFNHEEKEILSSLIRQALIQGNALVIFEGLDEVPVHIDRTSLMKEINDLLERGIDYDTKLGKLSYSIYERKEINSTHDPTIGNRFIVTSRIEGNYFEQINYYVPRLTIEDMSNAALKSFCNSYTECINENLMKSGRLVKDYKTDQLYDDISKNKDIFQLAINPQIASVIAAIYNEYEDRLPEKRIDLYEKAIEKMIERLTKSSSTFSTNYISKELGLNATILWSIMQEIAEYLHSKVEGLEENILKDIIRKCLFEYQKQSPKDSQINIDDTIPKLVDVFKYQAGLLNEFGHNSFRFIHRTFQEYLAAKSIIYFNGLERNVDVIVKSLQEKIANPNWRVSLSMTFGILSKSAQYNELFNNIIEKLFNNELKLSNSQFSTSLVPYVIIDSLSDMYFTTKDTQYILIRRVSEHLLIDYKNSFGFSRLKDHQKLIQSYFSKIKKTYYDKVTEWFIEKLHQEENIAPCANIIYQLKWYDCNFHRIFLKNLHNDSAIWNWPIDAILRFYSTKTDNESVLSELKLKYVLHKDSEMVQYIISNSDWLGVIVALYGGYINHNTPIAIREYFELSQFLNLSENQRAPFVYYYQDVWDRDDPAYSMAVYLDTQTSKNLWTEKSVFDMNQIYKESYLTTKLLHLLIEKKRAGDLIEDLRKEIHSQSLSTGEKIDALVTLITLGEFDFINNFIRESEQVFISSFANRLEQIMCTLKDPIARCSSQVSNFLLAAFQTMKPKQCKCSISFADYCKIYLSIMADCGGFPVDTTKLATLMDNSKHKYSLYAEYFAYKLTGAKDDTRYEVAMLLDSMGKYKSDDIINSFIKINDSIQMCRPIRSYFWPIDKFIFKWNNTNDLPISFFNCLENINTNISFIVFGISQHLFKTGYFNNNPDLIPLVVLLNFGTMSSDADYRETCNMLYPELADKTNIKEFLFEKISSISNPYYKSRGLSQLAQFSDRKSYSLLQESFQLTKSIEEPVLKFQVFEKILIVSYYKEIKQKSFIKEIVDELILSFENIIDPHDQVVASIRLSFYGSGDFRKKYLSNAIQALARMDDDEEEEQIQLILKLKPLLAVYDDLTIGLQTVMDNLKNKISKYYVHGYYGQILFTEKLHVDISDSSFPMSTKMMNITDRKLSDDFADEDRIEDKAINVQPNIDLDHTEPSENIQEYDMNERKPTTNILHKFDSKDRKISDDQNYANIQLLFTLFAQFNDVQLVLDKTNNLDQLWIKMFHDTNNQSNIENLLKIALENELILTPQAAIIIDELVLKGEEDIISIIYPYIVKPSNEVLPIIHRWFTEYTNSQIQKLAALLLMEANYVFEAGIDTLLDLLESDNDQIRYRAQRVFQHPERDVTEPTKRLSVIGERAVMKILQSRLLKEHLSRVHAYLSTFFFDFSWDDPIAYHNLYEAVTKLKERQSAGGKKMKFFNRIYFINSNTWDSILTTLQLPSHPSYMEEILHSVMSIVDKSSSKEEYWTTFSQILSVTDISQFTEKLYFRVNEMVVIRIILQIVCGLTNTDDEAYFQILESKIINEACIRIEDFSQLTYNDIKNISRCTFKVSTNHFNRDILDVLDEFPITMDIMVTLIKWSLHKMSNFKGFDDTLFSLVMCDHILALLAACIQKEHYLYRKITNSPDFHKTQMITLLEKILNTHPHFLSRGSAFILLSALDNVDQKVIINALNALCDENLVKEYVTIGIPLIHLPPNEFVDDLLKTLKNESAIKAYEILKILTQYTLDEKIDANTKSKIINYLAKEIGEFKSKKPINYYYTDIKIPFTTTLENELYKTWIKIQGLSGKAQYLDNVETSNNANPST